MLKTVINSSSNSIILPRGKPLQLEEFKHIIHADSTKVGKMKRCSMTNYVQIHENRLHRLIAGELMAGELMAGELIAGELMAGELMAGELIAGELIAGDTSLYSPYHFLESPVETLNMISQQHYTNILYYQLRELIQDVNIITLVPHITCQYVVVPPDTQNEIYMDIDGTNDMVSAAASYLLYKNKNDRSCKSSSPTYRREEAKCTFLTVDMSGATNCNHWIDRYVTVLKHINNSLETGGSCIIRLPNSFGIDIADFVYILTRMFATTILTRPTMCTQFVPNRFVICIGLLIHKNENGSPVKNEHCSPILTPLCIESLISEWNIIIACEFIEEVDVLSALCRNKSRSLKMDTLRRTQHAKCTEWVNLYGFL